MPRSLYKASLPLIVKTHVLENIGGVRDHRKCENARKSVVYVLFCEFSFVMTKC